MTILKISARHKVFLTVATLSLFLGFFNYILFQPDLYLLAFPQPDEALVTFFSSSLHHFFAGHFSDIAWCVSLYLCVVILSEQEKSGLADRIALLMLPFLTEIAQRVHLMYGTFDWYDIISYLIVLAIFIRLFPHLIFNNHEKA
jgi:hypothetical protein